MKYLVVANALILAVYGQQTMGHNPCPAGGTYDSSIDKCYVISRDAQPWSQARAECQRHGGDLVSTHSAAQEEFLHEHTRHINTGVFWSGLNELLNPSQNFTWSDGTPLDYTDWDPSLPGSCHNGAQKCMSIDSHSGNWFNCWDCNHHLIFVCEVPKFSPRTTASSMNAHVRSYVDERGVLVNL